MIIFSLISRKTVRKNKKTVQRSTSTHRSPKNTEK